jgi:hypothetical protein
LSAVAHLSLAGAAHADTLVAQAHWPPPAPPAPAAAAPRLAEPMTAPVGLPGPRVTLQVDNPNGRLQQHTPTAWRDVCIAPCGATVDPNGLYRVGGSRMVINSEPFQLPRGSREVVIDAQVGSKITHWVGLGLMIGGLVAAGYGFAVWQLFDSVADNGSSSSSSNEAARDFGRTVGIIGISVGVVLEIVGLPMFFNSTSVQVR